MFDLRRSSPGLVLLVLVACGAEPGDGGPRSLPGEAPSKVAAGSNGAAVTTEIPGDAPLVVVLGDSIAAGLHLSADEAFPAVLQRELALAARPFRLVNAGTSGDTTAGGLRRLDWILKQRPDVLVVELGGNDGLRGQDLAAIEKNLREIVVRGKSAGCAVILLGVQIPTSYGADYAGRFQAIYPRVAEELGAAFVRDFLAGVGGVPDMNLEDGLHPTAAGHRRIAENVRPTLTRILVEHSSRASPR